MPGQCIRDPVKDRLPKIVELFLVWTCQEQTLTQVDITGLKQSPSSSKQVRDSWTEILRQTQPYSKQCIGNLHRQRETGNSQMRSLSCLALWLITWLCNSKESILRLTTRWNNTPDRWLLNIKQQHWKLSSQVLFSVVGMEAHWQAPQELLPQLQGENQVTFRVELVVSVLFR